MNNSKSYDETQYTKWNKNNDKKEILDKLLKYFKESNINDFGYEQDKLISYEEAQILLDCITNLRKEMEKLRSAYIGEKLKNDKAIEYINTHYLNANEPKLLKILQGSDKKMKIAKINTDIMTTTVVPVDTPPAKVVINNQEITDSKIFNSIVDSIKEQAEEIRRLNNESATFKNMYVGASQLCDAYYIRLSKIRKFLIYNCIISDRWEETSFNEFIPIGNIEFKCLGKNKIKELYNIVNGYDDEEKVINEIFDTLKAEAKENNENLQEK